MQAQKLLTLCWYSKLGASSDILINNFAHKGGWYYDYGLSSLHSYLIIHNATTNIVDALLTLIVRR